MGSDGCPGDSLRQTHSLSGETESPGDAATAPIGSAAEPSPGPAGPGKPRARRRWTRWRYFNWTVRIGLLACVAGYLRFVGFDGQFYYPDRDDYGGLEECGLKAEDVYFPTRDGEMLHGWFFAAQPRVGETAARGTVIHFHGNAANITNHVPLVSWLPAAGYNLLMFDYRGYGKSTGKVTRAGTIIDGNAVLDYTLTRADVRGRPIFFYGQSLGGAVAVVVAADRPEVAGVVAESTFSNYRRIAAAHVKRQLQWNWLASGLAWMAISHGYEPLDAVPRLSPRPLLVIVGEKDEVCFPELGRELYAAAKEPKELWEVSGANHLEVLEKAGEELKRRVTGFFEKASRPAHTR